MKYVSVFVVFCTFNWSIAHAGQCPPEGYSEARLLALKSDGFAVVDDAERNRLALALTACTSSPNPQIRDGVAFEGLSTWLRGDLLTPATIRSLDEILSDQLKNSSDENGFQQPFAALILSEVARADRITPVFSAEQRADLVRSAATYLSGVKDYRGYSDDEGWRHGVAHASDLALQLSLNQNVDVVQLAELMDAVAVQIAPATAVSYTFGEPARLARPVFYAWQRGLIAQDYWQEWFESISDPAPFESWGAVYSSEAGLAKRHNTMAFLLAIHINAEALQDDKGAALKDMVDQAIMRILRG